jgi:DNA-binding IclR family transcriptional regulator
MADSSTVPALTRSLALLRLLGSRAAPVPAAALARELGLPRSTTYHLLAVLEREGFVVHLPEARTYGLGVAVFELGSAYLRHEPLERLARPLLVRLVARVDGTAHLGVLHGAQTLYLLKEGSRGTAVLVTDVGVRLPAHLTASGRAMLAALPRAQVRALYPSAASFVDRTGAGPATPGELRSLLGREAAQGWSTEDGHVTAGIASVAAAVVDPTGRPVAAVGVSFPSAERPGAGARTALAVDVVATADALSRRLGPRAVPRRAPDTRR